jgi:predicted flap endonuclease-1-like 5' DNA nuclease
MLRRLSRLLIILVLVAVVAFAASKLLGGDEDDFDDFDDLDSGFEFQETPVEIDVPASSEAAPDTTMSESTSTAADTSYTSEMVNMSGDTGTSRGTGVLRDMDESASATNNDGGDDELISINGIGAAYEARLHSIGINSISELANADAEAVASQIDVIGGAATVGDWIDQAKMHQNNGQS